MARKHRTVMRNNRRSKSQAAAKPSESMFQRAAKAQICPPMRTTGCCPQKTSSVLRQPFLQPTLMMQPGRGRILIQRAAGNSCRLISCFGFCGYRQATSTLDRKEPQAESTGRSKFQSIFGLSLAHQFWEPGISDAIPQVFVRKIVLAPAGCRRRSAWCREGSQSVQNFFEHATALNAARP